MFYCLDQFIVQYDLSPPFLDVGCGIGDLSKYLASKGWEGKAIDFSALAVSRARQNLASFPNIKVEQKLLFEEEGNFRTIFLWDVLEHIENDNAVLEKCTSLLSPNGHLLIAIPSNLKEWRWDDDFYGHCRRYTVEEISTKIISAGMKPLTFWDFTYPFFWIMRRVYTILKSPPIDLPSEKEIRTAMSPTVNAWDIPIISYFFNRQFFFWQLLYKIQFSYFRNKLRNGHEMFVLAKKTWPP